MQWRIFVVRKTKGSEILEKFRPSGIFSVFQKRASKLLEALFLFQMGQGGLQYAELLKNTEDRFLSRVFLQKAAYDKRRSACFFPYRP